MPFVDDSSRGQFFLGCAVWAFPGWVGSFYPPGTKSGEHLGLYGERLTAVEGNTTFYSIPSEETLARWRDGLPARFRFCPKIPRSLTHREQLVPSIGGARDFLRRVSVLGERLGPCFAQFHPSVGPERYGDVAAFLEAWPILELPLALEVRHPGWFEDEAHARLNRLLGRLGVGRVILDTRPIYAVATPVPQARRKPKLPVRPVATSDECFVRFIGHPELERNAPYLAQWAERVERWLSAGRNVNFFAHCPTEEQSPAIARMFQRALEERGAPVPPLPWDSAPVRGQLPLFAPAEPVPPARPT